MNAPDKPPMGMVFDMPMSEYLAIDAASNSALRELARSPWHLKNRVHKPATKPMLHGTLAHCALLEPEAIDDRYIVAPSDAPRRPTAAQWNAKKPSPDSVAAMEWWTQFNKRAMTREIVDAEAYSITQQQIAAIRANHYLAEAFSSGCGEVSMFWIDPDSGVYCKARLDWLHETKAGHHIILDLKTTADESPAAFSRTVANLGYYRQDAHYQRGFQVITGTAPADFVFAVVTSAPPILAVDYRLDDETQQQAREELDELLEQYAECKRTNYWPSYPQPQRVIGLPAWAKRSPEVEVSYAD